MTQTPLNATALMMLTVTTIGIAEERPAGGTYVPEATQAESRHIEGWGEVVDPTRQATVQLVDGVLEMTSPDTWVDNDPSLLVNAPRIAQSQDGAFTVEVTVQHVDLVEPFSAHESLGDGVKAIHAGTLMLRADDLNLVLFSRVNRNDNGKPESVCELQLWQDGERIVRSTLPARDVPAVLRLRIHGPKLQAGFSQDDGKSWKKFKPRSLEHLPPQLDVGVTMISNTESGSTVRFQSLKIEATE